MSTETKHQKHITKTEDFMPMETEKLIRLDLGCGKRKRQGFTGVDKAKNVYPDIVHDLDQYPYPFENNSVFEISTCHFIEHVKNLQLFMEECWRIMKNQATMLIVAPYYSSVTAWQDFTHVRSISEFTFVYFTQDFLKQNDLDHYNINCNFKIESMRYYFHPEWVSRSEQAKEWARKHYNNVVQEIEVCLRALK